MRITVKVNGICLVLPCGDGNKPCKWLISEAIERGSKLLSKTISREILTYNNEYNICLPNNGGILWPEDVISDVLENDGFVELKEAGKCGIISKEENNILKLAEDKVNPLITLDGNSLTAEQLLQLSNAEVKIQLSDEAIERVKEAREFVDQIVHEHRVVYGITTGFGKFAQQVISPDKLWNLQENLIRSHASGVGEPLSPSRTRMLMALRINVLAKGYSGISLDTLKQIIDAFNASCLPWIPEQGTVGASGDLAPLSHLALGLCGEGKMWSEKSGWAESELVLAAHGLKPLKLGPKEISDPVLRCRDNNVFFHATLMGIAMINGTQLITALGAEALQRSKAISRQADVVAALSLECLKGTTRAFDSRIHNLRPHNGQIMVAQRLRCLLNSAIYPSKIAESHRFCNRVQDAYTLRCCPQVHGIVLDTIDFVQGIITTEMNSATDNPMVFAEYGETISGGNFHGEYPAKALDYLAIGVHELSSMSERRIERLINPSYSELPAFLVKDGGYNSGFMLAHCTAASLVSENKVLCHPSSIDSISTSAGTEDHVSMGGFSARKALKVVENVERVLAVELLAACQAIEFLRPLTTTEPLEAVHALVRSYVSPWDKDRYMSPDIDKTTELLRTEKVWQVVSPFIDKYMSARSMKDIEVRPPSPTASSLNRNTTNTEEMCLKPDV